MAAAGSRRAIELSVGDLRQLFNSFDPAPFRDRDLDPAAADYVIDWARELPTDAPLGLAVHLTGGSAAPGDAAMLRAAVHGYFQRRAAATRRDLAKLLRMGRISLAIGLAFLAAAIVIGEALANLISKSSHSGLVEESLIIGGWVALWRPMEIFLYDWWPIRAEARLLDRLGAIDVSLDAATPEPPR